MEFEIDLVRRGILSAEQLVAAVERQQSRRPSIGELAVRRQKLTMKQAFDIFARQADTRESFEQAAREMRLLTRRQVADLSLAQAEQTPAIADILVEMGLVSQTAADTYFHESHNRVATSKLSKRKQMQMHTVRN